MTRPTRPRQPAVRPVPPRVLTLALALLAGVTTASPARALVIYNWKSASSGNFGDITRWSPAGVPGFDDYARFDQIGTYTVSFAASPTTTRRVVAGAGDVTFDLATLGPHTTGGLWIGSLAGVMSVTMPSGTFNADYLRLGESGSQSTLTLTGTLFGGAATFHSNSAYESGVTPSGDIVGAGGIATLQVFGGAAYVCDRSQAGAYAFKVGNAAGDVGNVSVAGASTGTFHYSSLRVVGSESGTGMVIGVSGTANVFAYNGGAIDVAGELRMGVGSGSHAYTTIGSASSVYPTSKLDVHGNLLIGNNDAVTDAGHAELKVSSKGLVTVGGRCDVGDPDNDAGSLLRLLQGAVMRVNGDLTFSPTAGPALDLRGGQLLLRQGTFAWPAGKLLTISSRTGTPEFTISGGSFCAGPDTPASDAQLFVGRGGSGTLRVTQPFTVLVLGPGATTLADSAGGVGTVVVDSAGSIASAGPVNVGVRGRGTLRLRGGAAASFTSGAVGLAAGGDGRIDVADDNSLLTLVDHLYVGGGIGGAGGVGTVAVDSNGVVAVTTSGGVNPPLVQVFGGGVVDLLGGGALTTPGGVTSDGIVLLDDGRVAAQHTALTSGGLLIGRGSLATWLQNGGVVSPGLAESAIGTFAVEGDFVQYAGGAYDVDLSHPDSLASDALDVAGTATLAGTLALTPDPVHPPQAGDLFLVLSAGSVDGTFDAVTWNGAPLADQAYVSYGAHTVYVAVPGGVSGVGDGSAGEAAPPLRFAPAGATGGGLLAFALDLPRAAEAEVKVFDLRGRLVGTLASGPLAAGPHRLELRGGGRDLASGVYLARAVIRQGAATMVRTARTVIVR